MLVNFTANTPQRKTIFLTACDMYVIELCINKNPDYTVQSTNEKYKHYTILIKPAGLYLIKRYNITILQAVEIIKQYLETKYPEMLGNQS